MILAQDATIIPRVTMETSLPPALREKRIGKETLTATTCSGCVSLSSA
jgi:hypothetical protein